MTEREARELLVERVVSAWRPPPTRDGTLAFHPSWHDLDEQGRDEAFVAAELARALEAAMDGESLSSTGRAVMARIRAAQR
ncbi:MAG: hypothetical protein KC503_00130 [Myxococcales bacterium]|nr:hypothetical protein [Myxococcales bacterium]